MPESPVKNVGLTTITGGTIVDVVSNYNWAIGDANIKTQNTPSIKLTEWQQTSQSIVQSIRFWYNQFKEVGKQIGETTAALTTAEDKLTALQKGLSQQASTTDPYKGLYLAERTGNVYNFPYLNPYHHSITNSWGENKGWLGEKVEQFALPVAKALFPSGGIETQKAWEGMQTATYDIEFQLLNTIDTEASNVGFVSASQDKNRILINTLINSNLAWRVNSLAAVPPCLYEVDIPNIRYSPAAIIQNLVITNLGHMDAQGIPDAYNIKISIQELINETRNIFQDVRNGSSSKVSAITPMSLESQNQAPIPNTNENQENSKSIIRGAGNGTIMY